MQNISISNSGTKVLNMVNGTVSIGYSTPFNYIDGQVDFNGGNVNNNNYAVGYSLNASPTKLTHFNGEESLCPIGLFWGDVYKPSGNSNSVTFPLFRNFCHIKTKYLSISGTSATIAVTNSDPSYQDTTSGWETVGSLKYMVNSTIPNVKYFLTDLIKAKATGGLASTYEQFLATTVSQGEIFPMYFPKRDTLVLFDNILDQT